LAAFRTASRIAALLNRFDLLAGPTTMNFPEQLSRAIHLSPAVPVIAIRFGCAVFVDLLIWVT
jgi:hypothetical protein